MPNQRHLRRRVRLFNKPIDESRNAGYRAVFRWSMQEQLPQDRQRGSEIETDHPLEQQEIGVNFVEPIFKTCALYRRRPRVVVRDISGRNAS
jgi:hypothetical protein